MFFGKLLPREGAISTAALVSALAYWASLLIF